MTKTPEGFLVCHNVPIARTGWYEYNSSEIGLDGDKMVDVYRSEDEVFSKASMASFECKIVTDEHPPDLLTSENSQRYSKGVLKNVRRCKDESDLLLADLVIHNDRLIKEVELGKREVSCGYNCSYLKNEDGSYSQVDIRGNHVAVVGSGRAGQRVSIKDSKNNEKEGNRMSGKIQIPRKKESTVTKFLAAVGLKQYAMDAEPDELSDVVDEMSEEYSREKNKDSEEATNKENEAIDESPEFAALNEKIDKLYNIVETLLVKDEEVDPEDAIDSIINEIEDSEEESEDGEEAEVVEDEGLPDAEVSSPENRPVNPIPNADKAWAETLRAVKPVIAAIQDKGERMKAIDSLTKAYNKSKKQSEKRNRNGYNDIEKAQRMHSLDNSPKKKQVQDFENMGDEIAKRFNANMKGDK